MKVLVFDQQDEVPLLTESVKPIVSAVLKLEGRSTDEVAIYFVSEQEISHLHQKFFDDPTPTDCISFPMDDNQESGYHILGEVFVCPKIAFNYLLTQAEEGLPNTVYHETTLYLVHGVLHILGYDDIHEDDVTKIRKAEKKHMKHLIRNNLMLKQP